MTQGASIPVAIGTHIGPYEIVGWLGAGGMGDVYRARDPRLGRDVAIKVIRERFAADAIRLHRFEQEARTAGQLHHPNILAVYDVGIHAGAPYIVSELLEGESLRTHLAAAGLPLRRAVNYARQTADGLAATHDKGIVHRDLKPDNLFITRDGRVKILDFGIAKLTSPTEHAARRPGAATETEAGMVVGTAGYMSPEQIRGEAVDARSDIFSFGAILYEMLTGCPAFSRETTAETMAAILKEDPLEPLPATVSSPLARIVSRCLEKTREMRFQSARDLAFGLEVLSGTTSNSTPSAAQATVRNRRWIGVLPWLFASALAVMLAVVLTRGVPWRKVSPPSQQRLSVDLGADASLASLNMQFGAATILSPDGTVLAFVAQKEERRPQLYVRRLDELQARLLPGTDDALAPFFSADGLWIGFFADQKLKKIAVTGGAPIVLADAPSTRGGAWSDDDTIVFAPNQIAGTRLLRVSAAGGNAEPLTSLAEGEVIQLWPQMLPGGKAVLYTASSTLGAFNDANLVVQPLPSGTRKVVRRGGYHGVYLRGGHLVYIHDGTLFAAPFDLDRLDVTGQPLPALEGVRSNAITGGAQFGASANGTLAYLPGQMLGAGTRLDWVDQQGKTTPLRLWSANWFNLLFAPDGRRLAMDINEGTTDIWVYEWARDTLTRVTHDPIRATKPVWTPDSRRIAFASARANKVTPNLYWQSADGTGDAERLTESKNAQQPASWHPSGKFLAFEETPQQSNVDLMVLPLEGDEASGWKPGKPTVFLNSPFIEVEPMFSPDGRWLAYSSNESGRTEVYVRPFPGPGGKWQISKGGGNLPTWSRSKRELLYGLDGRIMAASYTVEGDSLRVETPRLWTEGRYQTRGSRRRFDLHPDGERIALAPDSPTSIGAKQDQVVLIFNFFEELRRIAPATKR